ncbi:hypothetical protein [Leifsonia shinshuensis]|uniref:Uncharacterized protein n=1 Tax=Leifsonia shinshuensis TaxID=150026 RepID=A0A7G6Y9Q6_9MICO|nr:hypothetical protein [Leifsonia shinshuensis]QNE35221.1 hypothetical protein F1C12_08780 [Leifsonia shinshuensis]
MADLSGNDPVIDLEGVFRHVVDGGCFGILTGEEHGDPMPIETSEVFMRQTTSLLAFTGIAFGCFRLRIQAYGRGELPPGRSDAWEVVGEAVIEAPTGELLLDNIEPVDPAERPPNLAASERGRYAIRLSGRNRGLYPDLVAPSDPAEWEEYLLQVAPTETAVGLRPIKSDRLGAHAGRWMTVEPYRR